VPRAADPSLRPQVLHQFLFQHSARLNEQTAIDGFVQHVQTICDDCTDDAIPFEKLLQLTANEADPQKRQELSRRINDAVSNNRVESYRQTALIFSQGLPTKMRYGWKRLSVWMKPRTGSGE
jgi:hypothetical protein